MMAQRRTFQRPLGERRYKKLFVVAVEGAKTEPQYFALFSHENSVLQVKCLKGDKKSSPIQVLKRLKEHIKKENLHNSDEAWLVVDKDSWTDAQLSELHTWAQENKNHGLALSNPKFEYWLLLHFEEGASIQSSQECTRRLKVYLPDYDKGIESHKITRQKIEEAIRRAKRRDQPPCTDWPRSMGGTTVYRLVERIL